MVDPRPVHVSYATPNYSQAARLLAKTARKFGGLETRVYTPENPAVRKLAQDHPAIMNARRGAGYWLWKPFIVLDAMQGLPDGTPVLYTDVAMTFIADPAPLLALARQYPVCVFETGGLPQAKWTKRDCFVALDADTPDYWRLNQIWGGFQLYRAGPEARAFLHALAGAMSDETLLTDTPNTRGLPDLPGFVTHRHDQSILTILARKHGAAIFPDPSQHGPWPNEEAPYPQIVHLHRRANYNPVKWLNKRLRQSYNGGRGII